MRPLSFACLLLLSGCFLSGYELRSAEPDAQIAGDPTPKRDTGVFAQSSDANGAVAADAGTVTVRDASRPPMDGSIARPSVDASADARAQQEWWTAWWEAWRLRDAGARDAATRDAGPIDAGRSDASVTDAGGVAAPSPDAAALPCPGDTCLCGTGQCDLQCLPADKGGSCHFDCSDALYCTTTCHVGQTCDTLCRDNKEACQMFCAYDSECVIGCSGTTCKGICQENSSCTFACYDSRCDDIECLPGAKCRVLCNGPGCDFKTCWTEKRQCPDGSIVCGRECPP
jgi:hypothetical protein